MKENKGTSPFAVMALLVPAAEAGTGENWLPTLVLALVSCLIFMWTGGMEEPDWKWLGIARRVILILLLSWALGQTHDCWPGENAEWVVPAGLLILAGYAVSKQCGGKASSILRYGIYLVLGALALLGIPLLTLTDLRPSAKIPDMMLFAVLLMPLIGRRNGNGAFTTGIAALAASVLTAGSYSLYEYSRGLTVNGVVASLDSVAACGITIGYFGFLCYLLDAIYKEGRKENIWMESIGAYLLYAIGVTIPGMAYAVALLTLWVLIPALWTLSGKMKKRKNNA